MTDPDELCSHCGKVTSGWLPFCGPECQLAYMTHQSKGKIIAPNNLRLCCWRADGTMMEHSHADHPTYMYPVPVNFTGPIDDKHREDFEMVSGRVGTDQEIRDYFQEWHALIYTDGSMAVTIYECSYYMWWLRDGHPQNGAAIWGNLRMGLKSELTLDVSTMK